MSAEHLPSALCLTTQTALALSAIFLPPYLLLATRLILSGYCSMLASARNSGMCSSLMHLSSVLCLCALAFSTIFLPPYLLSTTSPNWSNIKRSMLDVGFFEDFWEAIANRKHLLSTLCLTTQTVLTLSAIFLLPHLLSTADLHWPNIKRSLLDVGFFKDFWEAYCQ